MAEGTRLRDLNEHMSTLESRMHKLTTEYQERIVELAAQIQEVSETEQKHFESLQVEAVRRHELVLKDSAARHEELLMLLSNRGAQNASAEKAHPGHNSQKDYTISNGAKSVKLEFRENKGKGILPTPAREGDLREEDRGVITGRNNNHSHIPYPRLEFPTFTGEEPRVWVENCEQYFERFEELRTQLLCHNPQLTEEHFISCYINGLREDLVPFMDIVHPNTLEEAYEQAKLHERALLVISRRYKPSPRTFGGLTKPTILLNLRPQQLPDLILVTHQE